MKILELFSGYGSQALALENLGIKFTSDISEIDKYAIQAYNQLHGQTHNWGDITKIDEKKLPYYDLITYSSPCQDFSTAGLQRGGDEGSGTRSSLLWECERIIRAVKPKYLLMENVKNLVGEKHKHNFIRWLHTLEMMGYWNFWQVLNSKDYGIPQNRERVFVVSILGGGQYLFPNKIKLEKRLKDILEPIVDEKYYLSDRFVNQLLKHKDGLGYKPCINGDVAVTLTTKPGQRNSDNYIQEPICIGGMQAHQSIKRDGISPCLTSSMGTGGGYVPLITEPFIAASRGRNPQNPTARTSGIETEQRLEINKTGCTNTLTSVQKDNYVVHQVGNIIETDSFSGNPQRGRIYGINGCSPCLSTMQGGGLEPKILCEGIGNNPNKIEFNGFHKVSPSLMATDYKNVKVYSDGYRIRKLTPRECFRLMGVKDEQFDKLQGLSNTQLYKMAGNSIVVDVLMAIFKNLFLSDDGTTGQLTLL